MSDLAIMFSGGLDSVIAYHYAKSKGYSPICINVGFGQPYDAKEQAGIEALGEWAPKVERIEISGLYQLIQARLSNQIIPSRNVLLATIGSMFAPRVWLGVLDGEQNGKEHDKSDRYFEDTSNLLSFTNDFFQPSSIIESPFRHMSKGEVIGWAINYGIQLDSLFKTSSCYDAHQQKCGKCLTCVKRYLAFLENGILEPGYTTDPQKSDYFKELCREIPKAVEANDYSRFTEKRAKKFIEMLDTLGVEC